MLRIPPHTSAWRRGGLVKGNSLLRSGTAIATFDNDGRYGNYVDGRSHAAIYLGQGADGIYVLDQWARHAHDAQGKVIAIPKPVEKRTIRFHKAGRLENDGDNYYVIE